ncbi:MAG: hypothetical protein IJM76_05095 [Lachnospiraceae bacterium]|nr:hypothetical protein [Lachnospiraceae bacterium]
MYYYSKEWKELIAGQCSWVYVRKSGTANKCNEIFANILPSKCRFYSKNKLTMMKKRLCAWMLACAAVIIVITVGMFAVNAAIVKRFRRSFVKNETPASAQYERKVPLHEMDLTCFSPYLPSDQAAVLLNQSFELPEDIAYYRTEDGSGEAALILKKGTRVSLDLGGLYGTVSLPTYRKGWRYTRPFIPANDKAAAEDNTFYYVRLRPLEKAAEEALKKYKGYELSRRELKESAYRLTRSVDTVFYTEGIFCSRDLNPWKGVPQQ